MDFKKTSKIAILLLISIFPEILYSKTLSGVLYAVDSKGIERPLDGVRITISHTGQFDETKNNGQFEIEIPENLDSGDKINLTTDKNGWSVFSPYDGETYIPKNWQTERLKIRIVPYIISLFPNVYYDSTIKNPDNTIGGYWVQVIVTSSKNKADRFISLLQSKGLKARSEPITLKKKLNYQVSTGPFKTEDEAKKVRDQLINDPNLPNDIFVP
ncbi:SPOR domain-containing protein [Thiothrix litoralis]|uniref:SPOR domain-containing protein n=1 Tax=Thiothrix litoralis TaxID=2891210 RepID=A0ABX7WU30_9GAMM|nr:SPOR domain-containing protein [Thiothrix litoralis]QTR47336.1 SPOR domain-containing protein [Thiothrix litoralis]